MKATRVIIRNYRGVEALDQAIGPGGAIVRGRNGAGKSSVLNAITAALAAEDIGPDAIRTGEDRAEIIVDLDALRVRRLITRNKSTVTVTVDGEAVKAPQHLLKELLGASGLDPLGIYHAKPDERRRLILQALPTRVTLEQVARWMGDAALWLGATGLHLESTPGLEVVRILSAAAYDKRTAAKKTAAASKQKAEQAEKDLRPIPEAPPMREAEDAAHAADRALEQLQVKKAKADGARSALDGNRRRAAEKRARAESIIPTPVTEKERAAHAADVAHAKEAIAALESQLADAKAELKRREDVLESYDRVLRNNEERQREKERLLAEAADLETSAVDVEDVAAEEMATAEAALDAALAQLQAARDAVAARAAHEAALASRAAADTDAATVAQLEDIMERLTKEAPKELAAAEGGIEGLTFEGDGIALEGVLIDKLSSAEQLVLSVEIAKRAAGKARILICDGLERLDPDTLKAFIRLATADGWQLLGTKVEGGERVIDLIEDDDAAEGRAA